MMSKFELKVSVIIPVYNCEDYLGEAIESVLDQTYPSSEIIVVDDGSTDDTRKVAEKYSSRIRYFFQPKGGTGRARNLGVQKAKGEFFAHLDADDTWHQDKLSLQMDALAKDPELDIVGCYMESFFSPELDPKIRNSIYCPPEALPGFSASAIVVKKEAFFRVGYYETHRLVGQDLSWFIRAREVGLKEKMIPEVLARRRLHASNSGIIYSQFSRERLQIIKESLDRRRKRDS